MHNPFLLAGAALSAAAALLHLGCIFFGSTWYRFFGAGKRMVQLASAGSWRPAIITSGIAIVLAVWSLYALSGAGIIPKLPLARLALCLITGIYLVRGAAGLPIALFSRAKSSAFWWWSSAICLGIGIIHLIGLSQVWMQLSPGIT